MDKKYVIATKTELSKKYLFWQPYEWDEGWTWGWPDTFKEVVNKHPEWNEWPHRFVFEDKNNAKEVAKHMNLNCCWIIEEL